MAHDHGGAIGPKAPASSHELLGPREQYPRGGRKARGDRVGGAMVDQRDLPAEHGRKLDRTTRNWTAISYLYAHRSISVGWKESKYRQSSSREWIVFGKGYNKVQAFRSQIENFARSINGDETLLITAEDALASVQVIEAAYSSLKQQNWVAVNGHAKLAKGAA